YPGVAVTPGQPPPAGINTSWRSVRGQVIKTYQCPSDPNNLTPYSDGGAGSPPETGWARGNYAANAGFDDYDHVNGGFESLSKQKNSPLKGVFSSPVMAANLGARLAAIKDGTSQTILFNEVRAGISPLDPRGTWALGFPSASITNGGRG